MKTWQSILLKPDTSIHEAIGIIDKGRAQIALVVNDAGHLLGTLGDGDIRRAIIAGYTLDDRCQTIMNLYPTTAPIGTSHDQLLMLMRRGGFHQIPLVDENGILADLVTIDDLIGAESNDHWVVLMAGGLGTRLHPLTEECPKPLLKIGNKPILENIIMAFAGQGFRKFFLSVNYKAEMVIDYFGDGSALGIEITYLHETERLGTAGSLSLLPKKPPNDIVVMNGDLLTHANFSDLVGFHKQNKAAATIAVREFEYVVPYGVINVDGNSITSIEEKPTTRHLVSSGIYALSPDALDHVHKHEYLDMPNLFSRLIESGQHTAAYRFTDYWLDIGRMEEFERAQREWTIL
jgi:dTDP-glucose pyrophosphorylase/predicted transcriptional regulator